MDAKEYKKLSNNVNSFLNDKNNFCCNYKNIYYDYQHGLRIKIVCLADETIDDYSLLLKIPGSQDYIKNQNKVFAFTNTAENEYNVVFLEKPKRNYDFEIVRKGEKYFSHNFSLKNENVLLVSPNIDSIEENIAFYSNCEKFYKKYKAKCYVVLNDSVKSIIKNKNIVNFVDDYDSLKNIRFYYNNLKHGFIKDTTSELVKDEKNNFLKKLLIKNENSLFENKIDYDFFINDIVKNKNIKYFISNYESLKCKYGVLGASSYILEVDDFSENIFEINKKSERIIKEPYVCICPEADEIKKLWLYENGWSDVVKYLKSIGYRVLCVGKSKDISINNIQFNFTTGAEDFSKNYSLEENINLIKDADFYIGLNFHLSWIAWLCKTPVVLISGSSNYYNEFYTPYRVSSKNSCSGCENDILAKYYSFFNEVSGIKGFGCPYKEFNQGCISKNSSGRFVCSKTITSCDVINKINEIPIVKEKINNES